MLICVVIIKGSVNYNSTANFNLTECLGFSYYNNVLMMMTSNNRSASRVCWQH